MNAFKNRRVAVIGAGNVGMMLLERMRVMGVPANLMAVCDMKEIQKLTPHEYFTVAHAVKDSKTLVGCFNVVEDLAS